MLLNHVHREYGCGRGHAPLAGPLIEVAREDTKNTLAQPRAARVAFPKHAF